MPAVHASNFKIPPMRGGPGVVPLVAALLTIGPRSCDSALRYLSTYDYDPAAQAGWLTLGKTDNLTLLAEGWAKYRIPALIELSQDTSDSLWCASNRSLRPCGGRDSATFAARLSSFGAAVRPHMKSGACVGAFLMNLWRRTE